MTSYLKGKDIKTQGDCLVYCYTRRIEILIHGNDCKTHTDGYEIKEENAFRRFNGIYQPESDRKPEGFEKF